MELQWKSAPFAYLQSCVRQVQNQEQTLELRITEGMPDIGRILCAWGQVQLRGKQWQTDAFHVSGGVNAWVLYIPEDGSEPRCVEGWIPFQSKWNLPENCHEGTILADVSLRNLDARTLSPRKMLLRASLALLGEAVEPVEATVYTPDEIQNDICLLRRSYPIQLKREAGEKVLSLEETLPIAGQKIQRILMSRLIPVLSEQAVTGSRMVLRGQILVQYVAAGEDDQLYGAVLEMPFAQLVQLDREYDKDATAAITMALSDAECSLQMEELHVKCNLIAQYTVCQRSMLQVTEDAYSPHLTVSPVDEQLCLPVLLDRVHQNMEAEMEIPVQAQRIVDATFLPDQPVQYREGDRVVVELPGMFQNLYYDPEGKLQVNTQNWSGRWELPVMESCSVHLGLQVTRPAISSAMSDRVRVSNGIMLEAQTLARQQIQMLSGLEIGQPMPMDEDRPSLILRRSAGRSLWELAKGCGSTVEAIEKANGIVGEPDPERMLLIPVV